MLDRILDLLSDLPISLIIFGGFLLLNLFSRDDKKQAPQTAPREADVAPPPQPSTYASDDRQYGNDMFNQPGSAFEFGPDEDMFRRDTQWGQTKFGFDEKDWGSTFGDDDDDGDRWGGNFGEQRSSEPRIEVR